MKTNEYFIIDAKYYFKIISKLNKLKKTGDKNKFVLLSELCAYNRLNTLTAIYKARHGWLGASFSIAEIITNLYFDIANIKTPESADRDFILLSKGHAAVMQYAALAGRGFIPSSDLLKYKYSDGPQAHTDMKTRGIEINSGSLGQSLSKACGLAYKTKNKVFVILGDGELQEGQNFEALMTLANLNLKNVIPVIDKNNIQSDSNVQDIKMIKNLNAVLSGLGFKIFHGNGNNIKDSNKILRAIRNTDSPSIFIAETSKGAGISFMSSNSIKRRGYSWHSGIPSTEEYLSALAELKKNISDAELLQEIESFINSNISEKKNYLVLKSAAEKNIISTGEAFSYAISEFALKNKNIFVLDADLEKSCKLSGFAKKFPEQFIEIGISEQDMVSFGGGLALRGKLPVINTYANFFRRAFEQVYINSTECRKIIYAGHYSGLCYATDGKSHQSTGDIAMMRSIPNMLVFHPATPNETKSILNWYINSSCNYPAYFKLHRTPANENIRQLKNSIFKFGYGIKIREKAAASNCVITSGPHLTVFCAEAVDLINESNNKNAFDLFTISTLKNISREFCELLAINYKNIFVIEENISSGGLYDELNLVISKISSIKKNNNKINFKLENIFSKAVDDFTFSTLDQFGLYKHFGLDKNSIAEYLTRAKGEERLAKR